MYFYVTSVHNSSFLKVPNIVYSALKRTIHTALRKGAAKHSPKNTQKPPHINHSNRNPLILKPPAGTDQRIARKGQGQLWRFDFGRVVRSLPGYWLY
jgi:hypothetical protein